MHRNARKTLGALVLVVVLASCADAEDSGPSATVPQDTPTTVDPFAVPATIDIPYLNRVFVALEKINGDATRLIVANRRITPEAAKLLDAIYTAEEFEDRARIWGDEIEAGLTNFRSSPGDRGTSVQRILTQRSDCISVSVNRDYSKVSVTSPSDPSAIVALKREASIPPNPTPWAIRDQFKSGPDPCA